MQQYSKYGLTTSSIKKVYATNDFITGMFSHFNRTPSERYQFHAHMCYVYMLLAYMACNKNFLGCKITG